MKHTKTALAVAIAGFAATPMMAAAETTLSGIIEIKYAGDDVDRDDDPDTAVDESKLGDPSLQAGDIRVGVVSEHELNNGLIGYGSIKLTLDDLLGEVGGTKGLNVVVPDSTADGEDQTTAIEGTIKADDIYVGVKGGFGDVRFGEIPLAVEYGQLANDIHDVADDVGDGASYTGDFGPVGLVLNYATENANDSDLFGAGAKFSLAGFGIGLGFDEVQDSARYAVGASYAIAGFSLALQYWAQEQDFDPDLVIDTEADDQVDASGFDIDDTTSFAAKVGYSIAGVALAVTYSGLESEVGAVNAAGDGLIAEGTTERVIRLDVGYDLGGGLNVSTRIDNTSQDVDGGDDPDDVIAYRVQLAKTF